MYLQFDPNKMHLQVIVGTLEKYEPNKEIEEIQKLVNSLTEDLMEFRKNIINPKLEEITNRVSEENKRFQESIKDDSENLESEENKPEE